MAVVQLEGGGGVVGDTCWYVQEGSKGIFHGRRYLTQSLGALHSIKRYFSTIGEQN